jgi:hypothetical protein
VKCSAFIESGTQQEIQIHEIPRREIIEMVSAEAFLKSIGP